MTRVQLMSVKLGKGLANLIRWFPNSFDETAITVSFSLLEHLEIMIYRVNYSDFTLENVGRFLQAHRQLKQLTIYVSQDETLDELLDTIIENKSILNLTVTSEIASVCELDFERLVSEHPLIEELTFWYNRFTADAAVMWVQQLNHLKQFKFQVDSRAEYDRLCNELNDKWRTNIDHDEFEDEFTITLNRLHP